MTLMPSYMYSDVTLSVHLLWMCLQRTSDNSKFLSGQCCIVGLLINQKVVTSADHTDDIGRRFCCAVKPCCPVVQETADELAVPCRP